MSNKFVIEEIPPATPEIVLDDLPEAKPTSVSDEVAQEAYIPPSFDRKAAKANPMAELAARTLSRRRLMPFIKRFRPKYEAGWVHEDICRRLERFVAAVAEGKEPRMLLMMPPRSGKQLTDITPVPTPKGWTTHGELQPGDEVFHPCGKSVKVLAVSEKTASDVKVTFSDGSEFYCHEKHEWTLYNRMRGEWQTIETGHFLRDTRFGEQKQIMSGGRATYQLPTVEALQYSNTDYTMHPYTLGAWLGDGSVGKPCITGAASDSAIIDRLVSVGYSVTTVCEHNTTKVLTTYFSGTPKVEWPGRMTRELKALGIYNDKRIPASYQRLTLQLRLELLAGLVDTDGTVDKNSRVSFTTVSNLLAEDVMELCTGLGFRPYTQEVQPKLSTSGIQGRKVCYVVGFQPTMDIPVALERKKITRFAKQRRIGLVSVERMHGSTEQGNCIEVDSPDGLYVVGKNLAATHNSEIGSRHFPPWVLGLHPDWEIIAASHTSSLTLSFSRYIRDLMRDPAYKVVFPDAYLDPASQSVENWNLLNGGGYLAAGVGTGITGRGAHILLLDDLVKDIEAADSVTIRDNTWEWYASTAYTRLAPGGGVLGIMCMTGDTPVLMADGTQRRLDTLKPSDAIATYDRGRLATSQVKGLKSNGRDSVLKITTNSGRIVRANQRHPFLALTPDGELKWVRARSLTTAHKIVALPDNETSGRVSLAPQKGALNQLLVAACVRDTTPEKSGLTGIAARALQTLISAVKRALSTATASLSPSTTPCLPSKTDCVPSVGNHLAAINQSTGGSTSPSTTATTPARSEGCSVTTATPESDTLELSRWHFPLSGISDFTLDQILSVEPDGEEEVFDVQVERTENFIANGFVSHNTHWNDDDWAGRIQQVMASGEGDKFEIVKYPAINEVGDEYILEKLPGQPIEQFSKGSTIPEDAKLTRPHNTAIHPARYTTEAMLRIKRNLIAAGQKRIWSALYQQSPAPDEGLYFGKSMMKFYGSRPSRADLQIFQAWDFAITEDEQNDYTVGVTLGQDFRDNLYVLDVRRFKTGDGDIIIENILDYYEEWGEPGNPVDLLGFEDGQIWKSLASSYQRACETRRLYPSFEILQPLTDKMVRAQPLRGRMQAGKVYFDEHADWYEELRKELMRFPAGKHDDQIDALAWAVRLSLLRQAPKEKAPPPLKSWRDKLNATLGAQHSAGHMSA